jgi:hypothetical protein
VQARSQADTKTMAQQFVAEILSDIEITQEDLKLQLRFEDAVAHDTAAMFCAAGDVAGTLHCILTALGARMEQIYLESSRHANGKYRLEQLLWAERVRLGELKNALRECSEGAATVVEECVGLEAQVQQHLVDRAVLEMQVIESLGFRDCFSVQIFFVTFFFCRHLKELLYQREHAKT